LNLLQRFCCSEFDCHKYGLALTGLLSPGTASEDCIGESVTVESFTALSSKLSCIDHIYKKRSGPVFWIAET